MSEVGCRRTNYYCCPRTRLNRSVVSPWHCFSCSLLFFIFASHPCYAVPSLASRLKLSLESVPRRVRMDKVNGGPQNALVRWNEDIVSDTQKLCRFFSVIFTHNYSRHTCCRRWPNGNFVEMSMDGWRAKCNLQSRCVSSERCLNLKR